MTNLQENKNQKNTQMKALVIGAIFFCEFLLNYNKGDTPTKEGFILFFICGLIGFFISYKLLFYLLLGSIFENKAKQIIILDNRGAKKQAIWIAFWLGIATGIFCWKIAVKLDGKEKASLSILESKDIKPRKYGQFYIFNLKTINQNHKLDQKIYRVNVNINDFQSIIIGKIIIINLYLSPFGQKVISWKLANMQEIRDSGVRYQQTPEGVRFFIGNPGN